VVSLLRQYRAFSEKKYIQKIHLNEIYEYTKAVKLI